MMGCVRREPQVPDLKPQRSHRLTYRTFKVVASAICMCTIIGICYGLSSLWSSGSYVALGASLFRAGAWMENVKSVFGVALLVMALYFLRPLYVALQELIIDPDWGIVAGLAIAAAGIGSCWVKGFVNFMLAAMLRPPYGMLRSGCA